MCCTTSITEGEIGPVKLFKPQYWPFCCGSLLPVFGVIVSATVSSYVYSSIYNYYILFEFGFGFPVATCWEIAAHFVDHIMFSLYFDDL